MSSDRLIKASEVLIVTLLPAITALILWLAGGDAPTDVQWDSPDGVISVLVSDGAGVFTR